MVVCCAVRADNYVAVLRVILVRTERNLVFAHSDHAVHIEAIREGKVAELTLHAGGVVQPQNRPHCVVPAAETAVQGRAIRVIKGSQPQLPHRELLRVRIFLGCRRLGGRVGGRDGCCLGRRSGAGGQGQRSRKYKNKFFHGDSPFWFDLRVVYHGVVSYLLHRRAILAVFTNFLVKLCAE